MAEAQIIIRKPDNSILNFKVMESYIGRLVTNKKLYEKDLEYIDWYVAEYGEINKNQLPLEGGILFIDLAKDIIYDSQGATGINKMTPTEILMSRNGKIPDETPETSNIGRFKDLVKNNYLKGFEQWVDHGSHLNTKFCNYSIDELLDLIQDSYSYGQFVFHTNGIKVETFLENDYEDQQILFNRLNEAGMLSEISIENWKDYLKRLK